MSVLYPVLPGLVQVEDAFSLRGFPLSWPGMSRCPTGWGSMGVESGGRSKYLHF